MDTSPDAQNGPYQRSLEGRYEYATMVRKIESVANLAVTGPSGVSG